MTKYFFKSLLKKPLTVKIFSWFISGYISFVFKTTRWKFLNEAIPQAYWKEGKPFMLCFWHNRLALMTFIWPKSHPLYMMISSHPDGQIISNTVGRYGIKTVVMSSKNGTEGIRNAMRFVKSGASLGITPDGPRGPRFQADKGALSLARMAKIDLIPASYSTTRRKILKSWDRLVVPLPFGRGVFMWGQPICLKDINLKESHKIFETALTDLTNHTDALCGHSAIPPRGAHERPIKQKRA
jgi:lysophospholipid acyltransferase (LPLAT)-like uncharacterized protein